MISTNLFLPIILLRVTPSANRNTYSVATLIIHIPRVEALHASTLGYEIATPTELPGVRTIQQQAPSQPSPRGRSSTTGPIPAFPKGKERHTTASNTAGMSSRPLGRAGEGLWVAGEGLLGMGRGPYFYLPALSIISLICWEK